MEIRQLKYFLAIADLGTVRAAAAANFITQPAVSVQLKRLEEELGEKLFLRGAHRMIPTETGEVVARHAREVLGRIEALEAALQGLRGLHTGHLRMGSIDAASEYVLPDIYRTFHQEHPGVRIDITVSDTTDLVEALGARRIELAAGTLPIDDTRFQTVPIYRDEMIVVANPEHELATARRVSLARIGVAGFIAYPAASTTRRIIEEVFAEHGARLHANMEVSSPAAMKRLVQSGLGLSILPRATVTSELSQGQLVELRTGKARFVRMLGVICRDRALLSTAARTFLEMVMARYPEPEA